MLRRVAIACAVLVAADVAFAETLPARTQALLTLRVLAYDRALGSRAGNDVAIAVLHEDGGAADRDALARAVEEAARGYLVSGRAVRVVGCPWRGAEPLTACLRSARAAALLVPERYADDVAQIARATRAAGALSFAPERRMVEAGLAIGLVQRASRGSVMVNLRAARDEGADLDAALLAVAEVVGREPGRR